MAISGGEYKSWYTGIGLTRAMDSRLPAANQEKTVGLLQNLTYLARVYLPTQTDNTSADTFSAIWGWMPGRFISNPQLSTSQPLMNSSKRGSLKYPFMSRSRVRICITLIYHPTLRAYHSLSFRLWIQCWKRTSRSNLPSLAATLTSQLPNRLDAAVILYVVYPLYGW
jgi:hypothetical protein